MHDLINAILEEELLLTEEDIADLLTVERFERHWHLQEQGDEEW